jgi:hypothetical protein
MVAAPPSANPVFRKLRRFLALLITWSSVFMLFLHFATRCGVAALPQ